MQVDGGEGSKIHHQVALNQWVQGSSPWRLTLEDLCTSVQRSYFLFLRVAFRTQVAKTSAELLMDLIYCFLIGDGGSLYHLNGPAYYKDLVPRQGRVGHPSQAVFGLLAELAPQLRLMHL